MKMFLKRLAAVVTFYAVYLVVMGQPAYADGLNDSHVRAFAVAAPFVTFLVSAVIPIITGLLTKWTLPGWIKGVLTLIQNFITAVVVTSTASDGTAIISEATLFNFIYSAVISLVSYRTVLRDAGLHSNMGGKLAPNTGVGPSPVVGGE